MRYSITKYFVVLGVLVVFWGAAAGPLTVFAEGVPLASPTPLPPERITAPEIFGLNPEVVLSEGNQGESQPSGSSFLHSFNIPNQVEPPDYVGIKPLPTPESSSLKWNLAVPLRTQEVGENTCGPAALGMVMDFIELISGEKAPTHEELVSFLKERDLFYEWGTGVQELAYAARGFGYRGSYAFTGWEMTQIEDSLIKGQPVVVSLGRYGKENPGHFVVVTGISDDGYWIVLNDSILGIRRIPRHEFINKLHIENNSGLVVK